MRYVQLANTSLSSSVLGFGCASLMGRHGRRVSLRALGTAFEQGVTYFDVARSYGWGDAERVLGEFVRPRRDRVVIATKLGIAPPPMPVWKRLARPVYRLWEGIARRAKLKRLGEAVRRQALRATADQIQRNLFTVEQARASLDSSLRALGVERVDILHLHSVQPADLADGQLVEYLQTQVSAGKVGYLGVATDATAAAAAIHAAHPAFTIFQMPNTLLNDELAQFTDRTVGIITHGPFGREQGIERLTQVINRNPKVAEDWGRRVGLDLTKRSGITELMLRYALAANARGVVLCGMHTPRNISANAAIASSSASEVEPLLEVAREIRATALDLSRHEDRVHQDMQNNVK